jgi:hypothetical protein
LRTGVIVGIMVLVILIVVGVTAAIVLSGTSSHPQPPQPGQSGGLAAGAAPSQPGIANTFINTPGTVGPAPATTGPAPSTTGTAPGTVGPAPATTGPAPSTVAPTGTTAPAAPAGSSSTGLINIGDGISLTPATGWSVESQSQKDKSVLLINADTSAEMFVAVGKVSGTDIAQVLSVDIKNVTSGGAFSNVQLTTQGQPNTLQSDRFQQELAVGYTADLQTQQGTIPVVGVFLELLNTSTGESAFVDVHAVSSDAMKKAAKDGDAMISSML